MICISISRKSGAERRTFGRRNYDDGDCVSCHRYCVSCRLGNDWGSITEGSSHCDRRFTGKASCCTQGGRQKGLYSKRKRRRPERCPGRGKGSRRNCDGFRCYGTAGLCRYTQTDCGNIGRTECNSHLCKAVKREEQDIVETQHTTWNIRLVRKKHRNS